MTILIALWVFLHGCLNILKNGTDDSLVYLGLKQFWDI